MKWDNSKDGKNGQKTEERGWRDGWGGGWRYPPSWLLTRLQDPPGGKKRTSLQKLSSDLPPHQHVAFSVLCVFIRTEIKINVIFSFEFGKEEGTST